MISTIIFGNGIGMALDPEYFQLTAGLNSAWDSFSKDEKLLISLGSNTMPSSEAELENHHVIMTACKKLMDKENNKLSWLSDDGRNFPDLYQNFIYKTAKYFFEYENNLPNSFIDSLIEHIKKKDRCHIATLNYDKLLYAPLIAKKTLSGYQDNGLVDGFHQIKDGFSPENLLRIHYNFGWYLHLHGSPVFKTTDGTINKASLNTLPSDSIENNSAHDHIIIAKTEQKPEIIANSILLGAYFEFFTSALSESDELYIIGYSGLDKHVNFEIKKWILIKSNQKNSATIKIIEWENSGHNEDFWIQRLFPRRHGIDINQYITIQLEPKSNILEYRFP